MVSDLPFPLRDPKQPRTLPTRGPPNSNRTALFCDAFNLLSLRPPLSGPLVVFLQRPPPSVFLQRPPSWVMTSRLVKTSLFWSGPPVGHDRSFAKTTPFVPLQRPPSWSLCKDHLPRVRTSPLSQDLPLLRTSPLGWVSLLYLDWPTCQFLLILLFLPLCTAAAKVFKHLMRFLLQYIVSLFGHFLDLLL